MKFQLAWSRSLYEAAGFKRAINDLPKTDVHWIRNDGSIIFERWEKSELIKIVLSTPEANWVLFNKDWEIEWDREKFKKSFWKRVPNPELTKAIKFENFYDDNI